ncbi:DUF6161 domain-containing protein [Sphingomonas sp. Leaf257]|uniref:DUF6161 domain-containing protein n=1 Tax=Sphingomonas sp. Leaf257 TaxID=1736309 RepID=UPI000B17895A|nr:DUF6161 domain-containing protein [Sphingomonas sp. Leaf257]
MVEVISRDEFGGPVHLDHISQAVLWCQREREDWEAAFTLLDENGVGVHKESIPCVDSVTQSWLQLEKIFSKSVDDNRIIDLTNADWGNEQTIVMVRSTAGQAFRWIYHNINISALEAAFAIAGIGSSKIDWTNTSCTAGAFHYSRIALGSHGSVIQEQIRTSNENWSDVNQKYNKLSLLIGKSLSDVERNFNITIQKIEEYSSDINSSRIVVLDEFSDIRKDLHSLADDLVLKSNSYHENVRETKVTALEEMEKSRKAFRDEVILQPAAQLWHDRAIKHERSANKFGLAAIGTGVAGIAGTPLIAFSINKLARYFVTIPSDVNITADQKLEFANTILHTQLIVAASVTLLWVTMSLWVTRVLVRNYVQQRRLAVDAAGREAMTQTYIGLMLEGGVKDNERPIVLSNLFLPVSDGTTDDGPPVISMPSLLATMAAGKQA